MEMCAEFWWGNIIQAGVRVTVSILNGLWLGQCGDQYPPRARDFFLPMNSDKLWGPPSVLFSGYQRFLSPGV